MQMKIKKQQKCWQRFRGVKSNTWAVAAGIFLSSYGTAQYVQQERVMQIKMQQEEQDLCRKLR